MLTSNSRVGSKSLPTLQDDHLVDQYLAACREVVYLNVARTLALARHPGRFPSERRTSWRVCFSGTSIDAAVEYGENSTLCFASSVPLSHQGRAALTSLPPLAGERLKLPSPLVGEGSRERG